MKKGMTLVEILVALIILVFVLGAIYTILNMQTVRATQVEKTSILQTDAQVALSLLKWDLAMAGIAFPKEDYAVLSSNGGSTASDGITVRGAMLGFESGRKQWSWLLEDVSSSQIILVRAWDDTLYNFRPGDTLVVIDRNRRLMYPPGRAVVQATASDTFYDPHGNPFPGQALTLDKHVSAIAGLVVIGIDKNAYDPGVTLNITNSQLMRGNEIMLDNVEDIQFAYGIDNDNDNIIETWTDDVPAFASANRRWAIRYTMVLTSDIVRGYTYPDDTVAVEDHSYTLTDEQKRRKRTILSGIISPPNLQP
jgi:prepilin-type N-terminal cleavage/methylation domain-containing protein